ncbi:hypothetical protein [Ghiorsea bivora]|uniref:hypothetical protein n=1 Tax=Ghiorsea bivora TaxID=1485545 RepID=UPI00056E1E5D|nr:hypothetical protein [Ghiorsea bivora]
MVGKYKTAETWRDDAMQREHSVSDVEIASRRKQAEAHYEKEGVTPDADTLADHELFILGKMDMQEYEQYLLFKHSQNQGDT